MSLPPVALAKGGHAKAIDIEARPVFDDKGRIDLEGRKRLGCLLIGGIGMGIDPWTHVYLWPRYM